MSLIDQNCIKPSTGRRPSGEVAFGQIWSCPPILCLVFLLLGTVTGCDKDPGVNEGPVGDEAEPAVSSGGDSDGCELPELVDYFDDGPLTDVECYSKLNSQIWSEDSPFPLQIPSAARDVRFSYMPRIMQGAGWHYLAMTLDDESLDRVVETASRDAMRTYDSEEVLELVLSGDPFARVAFESGRDRASRDVVAEEITESTRVYLYEESGREECRYLDKPKQLYCNHFSASGVTVFHDRNEVLFWAYLI